MFSIQYFFACYRGKLDSLDLELLVAHAIKKSREFVLAHPEYLPTKHQVSCIEYYASRRIKGEPVAYVIGHKEFFGLDFKVTKNTLIPRPETEILVEKALEEINKNNNVKNTTVIDVGTGSGCIIISVAKNYIKRSANSSICEFVAVDTSLEALRVAKLNAEKNSVHKKIKFAKGDLLKPVFKMKKHPADNSRFIILANLPYLSEKLYDSAPISVKKYEPRSALHGGLDGLDYYRKLFQQIEQAFEKSYLKHAAIILEFSPEQKTNLAKTIKEMLPRSNAQFFKDLCGKWRVCKIKI